MFSQSQIAVSLAVFIGLAAAIPYPFIRTSGRNGQGLESSIRHLPCAKQKQTGVCMFAWDCMKVQGEHLGTCVDRFYFGSCCKMKVGSKTPTHKPMDADITIETTLTKSPENNSGNNEEDSNIFTRTTNAVDLELVTETIGVTQDHQTSVMEEIEKVMLEMEDQKQATEKTNFIDGENQEPVLKQETETTNVEQEKENEEEHVTKEDNLDQTKETELLGVPEEEEKVNVTKENTDTNEVKYEEENKQETVNVQQQATNEVTHQESEINVQQEEEVVVPVIKQETETIIFEQQGTQSDTNEATKQESETDVQLDKESVSVTKQDTETIVVEQQQETEDVTKHESVTDVQKEEETVQLTEEETETTTVQQETEQVTEQESQSVNDQQEGEKEQETDPENVQSEGVQGTQQDTEATTVQKEDDGDIVKTDNASEMAATDIIIKDDEDSDQSSVSKDNSAETELTNPASSSIVIDNEEERVTTVSSISTEGISAITESEIEDEIGQQEQIDGENIIDEINKDSSTEDGLTTIDPLTAIEGEGENLQKIESEFEVQNTVSLNDVVETMSEVPVVNLLEVKDDVSSESTTRSPALETTELQTETPEIRDSAEEHTERAGVPSIPNLEVETEQLEVSIDADILNTSMEEAVITESTLELSETDDGQKDINNVETSTNISENEIIQTGENNSDDKSSEVSETTVKPIFDESTTDETSEPNVPASAEQLVVDSTSPTTEKYDVQEPISITTNSPSEAPEKENESTSVSVSTMVTKNNSTETELSDQKVDSINATTVSNDNVTQTENHDQKLDSSEMANDTEKEPEVTEVEVSEPDRDQLADRLANSTFKEICGQPVYPSKRIVGGSQASFGEWPWQVSLRQWRSVTFLHKCGAALVNENWAITAAHCVENAQPDQVLLRIGEYDLERTDEPYGHVERKVQIIATHPQFDPNTFEYDVALLRFSEPVTFAPNIIPICIPDTDYDFIGDTGFVTGWGRLYEAGPLHSKLQEVEVPVVSNDECSNMFFRAHTWLRIPKIMMCAGYASGMKDACEGDSGGPLVIQHGKSWKLAGVISWGIGCALPNQPGVYTRISAFREWINKIMVF